MARRLSPLEVAAARSDPRLVPRPCKPPKDYVTDTERLVAQALQELGLTFHYEQTFFPTQWEKRKVGCGRWEIVELGFRPDFRVEASRYGPEQYLEVTTTHSHLSDKHRKIANAAQVYDISIVLLDRHCLTAIRHNHRDLLGYLVAEATSQAVMTG